MNKKEIIPILLIVALFAASIYAYAQLPDKIPTHWNAKGAADAFGSKATVFLLPSIALISYLLFLALPHFDVYKKNIEKSALQVYLLSVILVLFFAAIHMATIMQAMGYRFNMNYVVIPVFGILFISIGLILPKIKRNFFIGIRTPWTLTSDKVWEKTHNIGGKVFVAIGVLTMLGVFFIDYALIIMLCLTLVSVIYLVAYSYRIYDKKEHK